MEYQEGQNRHFENQNIQEHVIDISRLGGASSLVSPDSHHNNSNASNREDVPSISTPAPAPEPPPPSSSSSSVVTNHGHVSSVGRGNDSSHTYTSPINTSAIWISIEVVVLMSQIVAAVVVLSLSRHEKPKTPLFEWILCYAIGCVFIFPHIYWRCINRNSHHNYQHSRNVQMDSSNADQVSDAAVSVSEPTDSENNHNIGPQSENHQGSTAPSPTPRRVTFVSRFKMAVDLFFAIWFAIGNIWVFGGRSSASDAPNLYRLSIAFLMLSCIGYALPFFLFATIFCCLPCIISIFGFRYDTMQNRGATSDLIDSLPTYKFKLKRSFSGEIEIIADCSSEGGILAAGTEKERFVSAEDAVCCICLARYADNDDLRELPCAHFFHKECVDKWLKINALCPLCKSEIVQSAGA